MKKLLFVAQFPPPFGGQTIMQKKIFELLKKRFSENIIHVSMQFSSSMSEVGGFSVVKIKKLIYLVFQIIKYRVKGYSVLYYPPSGPDSIPIIRDLIVLSVCRIIFDDIIFHFHASGLSEYFDRSDRHLLKKVAQKIFRADNAILLSNKNAPDDRFVKAKNVCVIPYGIEDPTKNLSKIKKISSLNLLYVGVLKKSKGILNLLEAFGKLNLPNCYLNLVGEFDSEGFKTQCREIINKFNISDKVIFHGVKTGKQKWKCFSISDIFVFPTYFESESFGLVLVEAMSFSLPIIATDWRGVPGVVDKECSIIIPPKDTDTLSKAISKLYNDEKLRRTMGIKSRKKYEKNYTIKIFEQNLEDYFHPILIND